MENTKFFIETLKTKNELLFYYGILCLVCAVASFVAAAFVAGGLFCADEEACWGSISSGGTKREGACCVCVWVGASTTGAVGLLLWRCGERWRACQWGVGARMMRCHVMMLLRLGWAMGGALRPAAMWHLYL
jgi:hypothetical protein